MKESLLTAGDPGPGPVMVDALVFSAPPPLPLHSCGEGVGEDMSWR